jgi:hypothetical protein
MLPFYVDFIDNELKMNVLTTFLLKDLEFLLVQGLINIKYTGLMERKSF